MAGLNVRNLISRFEQLTTGFENNEAKSPKSPITPKPSTRQFFPETVSYTQKNNNTKLLKIDAQIAAVKEQIRVIEEVSNDDFVKILFSLLNLLIELGAIEVDGNYNVKQKKTQCFNAIIECKESLVQCLDEEFAVESGIIYENMVVNETEDEDEVSVNEVEEPSVFCAVSKIKNFFESKSKDQVPPAPSNRVKLEPKTPTLLPMKYFGEDPVVKSPKNSTDSENSEISDPETIISKEDYDKYTSNNSLYESNTEMQLNSVKKIKDLFEAKSTDDITKARSSTTLDKLIRELSPETVSASSDDDDDDPQTTKAAVVDKQRALMGTLVAELEYYKSLIESMDPSDDIRAEVLEENLVEMFLEINKIETFGDEGLSKQKEDAIFSAQILQTKINENKTNIGHYITNLEENEENHPKLPPAGDFEAILAEVERYKELVANYDLVQEGSGNGRFLEENICEVLLLLDNYGPDDETEKGKKMRAIKDLGLILNELSRKKNEENSEEKHYVAVRPEGPDKDDNELVLDVNFKNYIAVCPPAPPGYQPNNQIEIDDEVKGQYSELLNLNASNLPGCDGENVTKRNDDDEKSPDDFISGDNLKSYIAVCPPAPPGYQPNNQIEIDDEIKDQYSELLNLNSSNPPGGDDETVLKRDDNDENSPDDFVSDDNGHYLAICPVAPPGYQPTNPFKIDDDLKEQYSELLSISNPDDDDVEEQFDELVKENLTVQAKDELPAATRLKDIGVEVNIFKKILEELEIFDLEELEIFKTNVAEIREILLQLECHGDPEIELEKKDTLEAVREIQDQLEKFVKK